MNRIYKRRFILFILLVGVVIIVHYLGLPNHISLTNIKKNKLLLENYIYNNYIESVLVYIGLYIFLASFALPVSFLMTMAGGFLFGTVKGALYATIGATVGSCMAFLLIRYLIGNWIHDRFGRPLKAFNREMKKHGSSYLLSIHFISVIPLFLVNIVAGLANVGLWTFFWTTIVGIFPGVLVYSFAGRQLTTINSVKDIFSWHIFIAFLGLLILAILPLIFRKRRKKKDDSLF